MPTVAPHIKTDEGPAGEHPPVASPGVRTYVCPGETHAISRAVHLSRLAAFYAACRVCPHRQETGHLPRQIVDSIERTIDRVSPATLMTREGVRGIYLNEIGRTQADRYAAAFAGVLWQARPLTGRSEYRALPSLRTPAGPTVVLGHDARPSAVDLAVGAANGLRRMGCEVVDVGRVTTPCLWFAVRHLEASAGLYITGSGGGPAAIGLDFVGSGGVPWSHPGGLDAVEAVLSTEHGRPTRSGGGLRSFAVDRVYRAALARHFQTLRPLRIGLASLSPTAETQTAEFIAASPCHVETIPASLAANQVGARKLVLRRLGEIVRERRLHAGFLLEEDGQTLLVCDENGRMVKTAALTSRLAELLSDQRSRTSVVVDGALAAEAAPPLEDMGCRVTIEQGSRETMSRAMTACGGVLGAEAVGRFWIRDGFPTCDALLSMAATLRYLSLSGAPASLLHGT